MNKAIAAVFILSLVGFILSKTVAQDAHSIAGPKTVTIAETTRRADGSVSAVRVTRKTWRSDGSSASDTISTVLPEGLKIRTRSVRDLGARREITMFLDLGVKMAGELPERAVHRDHTSLSDCGKHAKTVGSPADGDLFLRRTVYSDGSLTQRFDPSLGCEPVKHKRISESGVVYSEAEVIASADGPDESLFADDPSLQLVSRVEFLARYESIYGRPFFVDPDAAAQQSARDVANPLITTP